MGLVITLFCSPLNFVAKLYHFVDEAKMFVEGAAIGMFIVSSILTLGMIIDDPIRSKMVSLSFISLYMYLPFNLLF